MILLDRKLNVPLIFLFTVSTEVKITVPFTAWYKLSLLLVSMVNVAENCVCELIGSRWYVCAVVPKVVILSTSFPNDPVPVMINVLPCFLVTRVIADHDTLFILQLKEAVGFIMSFTFESFLQAVKLSIVTTIMLSFFIFVIFNSVKKFFKNTKKLHFFNCINT